MKDPVEIAVPSSYCVLVIAHVEGPRDDISLTTFDDLSLDLSYGPATGFPVSHLFEVWITKSTHDVSR